MERARTVAYWDGNARWYHAWVKHNPYHRGIVTLLLNNVHPWWEVLDIGGGSGILSFPLMQLGCRVTVIEPARGMRQILLSEAQNRGLDSFAIDERPWEEIAPFEYRGCDLVLASNSLHLTRGGINHNLQEIFRAAPRNVLLVAEPELCREEVRVDYLGYELSFSFRFETESSFVYHTLDEAYEHWSFRTGRALSPRSRETIRSRLIFGEDHYRLPDRASVSVYWWRETKGCSHS